VVAGAEGVSARFSSRALVGTDWSLYEAGRHRPGAEETSHCKHFLLERRTNTEPTTKTPFHVKVVAPSCHFFTDR
jgi:hypothetical protein